MSELELIENFYQNYYSEDFVYRPFVKSDAFPLFEATKHPEFNKFLLWDQPKNFTELLVQVEYLLRQTRRKELLTISVCERKTSKWIGYLKYGKLRDGVEITTWYNPEYWGKKVIISSMHALFEIIFEKTDVQYIYFQTKKDNVKVNKIAKHFKYEQCEDSVLTHQNGDLIPFNVYRIPKEHYKNWNVLTEY